MISPGALFAEDFDAGAGDPVPEPEIIEPVFSAAELEAARAAAWQAGSDDATAKAAASDHAVIRETVAAMAEQLAATRDDLIVLAEQSATMVARLLLGSLGAVLPALAARYGEADLHAVVHAVLPGLFKEPAVTVRVHPCHAAAVGREIEQRDPDLAARLQIVPTESVSPGDVRIAWCNGGAARDVAALWAQATEALALAGLAPALAETREMEHAG